MSSDLLDKCEEYFDTRDFYEVLKVERNATDKEIKKAYHKMSLFVHPDRVEEKQKLLATEKFKILGKIHSILQNSDKRRIYDDCGEFDDESDIDYSWVDYWRNIFKKITQEDIENFERGYLGSETEERDLKKAYINGGGSMDFIINSVPFSSCKDESRFIEIMRKLVEKGEVQEFDCFFNEPKKKKERRHRKEQRDRQEFEEDQPDAALLQAMETGRKKRQSEFASFMHKLEAKYTKPSTKRKRITSTESTPTKRRRSQRAKK